MNRRLSIRGLGKGTEKKNGTKLRPSWSLLCSQLMILEFSWQVTHMAAMTLDEEGSEAAAATSIQLTPRPHPELNPTPAPGAEFNRPFLVMTFHTETGSMLFLGKIVNPLG